jgi:hypothetical protein
MQERRQSRVDFVFYLTEKHSFSAHRMAKPGAFIPEFWY